MTKYITYFLVLAFLNFLIAPECSLASSQYFQGDISGGGVGIDKGTVIAVTVGLVVVIVGVYLLVSYASKKPAQPQEQQQKPTDTTDTTKSSKNEDEQIIGPSGQVALLRW
jgi:predicted metalloprotease